MLVRGTSTLELLWQPIVALTQSLLGSQLTLRATRANAAGTSKWVKGWRVPAYTRFAPLLRVSISSWLCSAHPAEALAQLLCEKSRLLEGGEVGALLQLAFSSASRLREAAS